jgi:hypothetical protein
VVVFEDEASPWQGGSLQSTWARVGALRKTAHVSGAIALDTAKFMFWSCVGVQWHHIFFRVPAAARASLRRLAVEGV